MSIITKIEGAEHTFAAYAEKEWTKLYDETPKIASVASTVLKYVGPALQMVVTAEAGAPAGAIVGSVVKEAQTDLLAASSLIYDFGASPSLSSVFSGVTGDLSALLTAGHVKSAGSVAIVNRVIQEIEVLASAVKNAITAPVSAPVAAPAVAANVVTPRA